MSNNNTTTREPTDEELAEAVACIREHVLKPDPGANVTDALWATVLAWSVAMPVTEDDIELARASRTSRTPAVWREITLCADAELERWGLPARFAVESEP